MKGSRDRAIRGTAPGSPVGRTLARVAACTACPTMRGYRKFPVSAAGRRDARFALVGEAPGIASIETRRQWTGAGGMVLRREVRRLGLDLEDLFYLTNAVKCWPAASGRRPRNRSPLRSEALRCRPFLMGELAALRPQLVVAVGAVAARALIDHPIRFPDDHGRHFVVDGREVVVLLHPANASRHPSVWPGYRASLLALFAELAARAGFPVVEVTAAIVERDGRYLVARRPPGRQFAKMWEFPGGKRQAGESLAACLRRELAEELGVEARVGASFAVVPWTDGERRVVLHFLRCEMAEEALVPREGQSVRWVTAGEMAGLSMPPADAEVGARLRAQDTVGCPPR